MLILLLSSRHASSKSVLRRAKRWREILARSLQASHLVRASARQSRSPFTPSPQTVRLAARTHRTFLTFAKMFFFSSRAREVIQVSRN